MLRAGGTPPGGACGRIATVLPHDRARHPRTYRSTGFAALSGALPGAVRPDLLGADSDARWFYLQDDPAAVDTEDIHRVEQLEGVRVEPGAPPRPTALAPRPAPRGRRRLVRWGRSEPSTLPVTPEVPR